MLSPPATSDPSMVLSATVLQSIYFPPYSVILISAGLLPVWWENFANSEMVFEVIDASRLSDETILTKGLALVKLERFSM